MKTKGFTLVELLVVIAILAILATVSVVGYTSFINRAEDSNAQTELHQVVTYLQNELLIEKSMTVVDYGTTTTGDDKHKDDTQYVIERTEEGLKVTKKTWHDEVVADPSAGTEGRAAGFYAVTPATNEDVVTAAFRLIEDFDVLKGTFAINGFELTYTNANGGTAKETLKFR